MAQRDSLLNLQRSIERGGDIYRQNRAAQMAQAMNEARMTQQDQQFQTTEQRMNAILGETQRENILNRFTTLWSVMKESGSKDPFKDALDQLERTSPSAAKVVRSRYGDVDRAALAAAQAKTGAPGGNGLFAKIGAFRRSLGEDIRNLPGPAAALQYVPTIFAESTPEKALGDLSAVIGGGAAGLVERGLEQAPIVQAKREQMRTAAKARTKSQNGSGTPDYMRQAMRAASLE